MVNENLVNLINNKKPVEEVREIDNKYEIPSFEEFMKTYESDGNLNYDDLNLYDISSDKCYGPGDGNKGKAKREEQHLIHTLNKHVGTFDKHDLWDEEKSAYDGGDYKVHNFTTSSGTSVGVGGMIAGGSANYSVFRVSDNDNVDVKFFGGEVGAEAGMGIGGLTAGYSANVDVMNARVGPGRVRVGIDLGSSATIGAGRVEVKASGFGFSVGKKTGISTPLGEVAVDADDCVVQ